MSVFHPESLPADLCARPQWLLWKLEPREGKLTKVPYDARAGEPAKWKNRETWCTFDEALIGLKEHAGMAGVGFVFDESDPYVAIDLDNCIEESGELAFWAQEIVERLDTYTERSQSGRGIHAITLGDLPPSGRRKGPVEMYVTGRFFAVTGDRVEGTPAAIEDRAEAVLELHAEVFGKKQEPEQGEARPAPPPLDLDDTTLLDKARNAKNGNLFRDLFDSGDTGKYGGDDSGADQALCNLLAFWTQKDAGRMDRLFRRSALCYQEDRRAKWDSRRNDSTYGRVTIETAIAGCREVYDPVNRERIGAGMNGNGNGRHEEAEAPAAEEAKPERRWRSVTEMRSRPKPEYRVEGVLPEMANAVIYGASGIGKTFVALDLVFHIATGANWHGRTVRQGAVAYLAAEGGFELGIRMDAWMMERGLSGDVPIYTFEDAVNFLSPAAVASFAEELRALPEPPAVLVVDTLALVMAGGDENSGQDMGRFNEACRKLRRELGIQILTIHHVGRAGDHERGHTSLRAANDTMIEVTSEAGIISVGCTKQRNGPKFEPLTFSLVPFGDSCVLGEPAVAVGNLSRADRDILEALADCEGYLPRPQLLSIAGGIESALTRKLNTLQQAGYIEKEGKARSKLGGYRITFSGREMVSKIRSRASFEAQEPSQNGVSKMPLLSPSSGSQKDAGGSILLTSCSSEVEQDENGPQARNGAAGKAPRGLAHILRTLPAQDAGEGGSILLTCSPPLRGEQVSKIPPTPSKCDDETEIIL